MDTNCLTKLPPTPWGQLPPELRVLFITSPNHHGDWLAEALANDQAAKVTLAAQVGITAGVTLLREVSFDTVLIDHDPGALDALAVVDAIRTGSTQRQPVIVLGRLPESQMTALCFESGADGYICLETATIRDLLWMMARSSERHQLIEENERLSRARNNQVGLERDETDRLLDQQRQLIARYCKGESNNASGAEPADEPPTPWHPPDELRRHYGELLRAYVIMGSGNLGGEIARLARLLKMARLTSWQTVQLHVEALEEMLSDLGTRSSRHILNRANLLVLEAPIGRENEDGGVP